jgi:hypothetical protein
MKIVCQLPKKCWTVPTMAFSKAFCAGSPESTRVSSTLEFSAVGVFIPPAYLFFLVSAKNVFPAFGTFSAFSLYFALSLCEIQVFFTADGAEYMWIKNLVVVSVRHGIGAGILIDGKLFQGDGGGAGEIGHVVVQKDGLYCRCGKRGCLETVTRHLHIAKK